MTVRVKIEEFRPNTLSIDMAHDSTFAQVRLLPIVEDDVDKEHGIDPEVVPASRTKPDPCPGQVLDNDGALGDASGLRRIELAIRPV